MDRATNLVVFDGECGVCARTVAWMARFASADFTFIPHQELSDADLLEIGLSRARCERAMQTFNARRAGFVEGHAAIHAVLRSHPVYNAFVNVAEFVPGFALVESFAYGVFARHRRDVSAALGLATCKVPLEREICLGDDGATVT